MNFVIRSNISLELTQRPEEDELHISTTPVYDRLVW
jgi:hypothetical protein